MNKDVRIEDIEKDDDYSEELFDIRTWGKDLSLRELITMYDEGELIKPELQRRYVWDKKMASKFIESVLMGLPVPSIFLANYEGKQLIIDGYQRIMTVYDYVSKGFFSNEKQPFKLMCKSPKWEGKIFEELSIEEQRRIKGTTIHTFVFEQIKPEKDNTSMYQIFERINTGGRTLTPQEIRNCVYQGSFNTMLMELNGNEEWRELFGSKKPDSRMRDVEAILRFFAVRDILDSKVTEKRISLCKYLNLYMKHHKKDDVEQLNKMKQLFNKTLDIIYKFIGENAFHNYVKGRYTNLFHPAIYDAIMVAISSCVDKQSIYNGLTGGKHLELLENDVFRRVTTERTTDIANIKKRVELAKKILLG